MYFNAFLYPIFVLAFFVIIMFLSNLRVSFLLNVKSCTITYKMTGRILKYIKIFEVKSGDEKKKRNNWKKSRNETKPGNRIYYKILQKAFKGRKMRMIHIERLILEGTYSIGDAAVNAIFLGFFMALWQLLLLFLNERFILEQQKFEFTPDFHNDQNDFFLQIILRVTLLKFIWLILIFYIKIICTR